MFLRREEKLGENEVRYLRRRAPGKIIGLSFIGMLKLANSFLPFDREVLMRRLLRICLTLWPLLFAGPLCLADTTADLRNVFTYMPSPEYPRRYRIEGITVCRVYLDAQRAVTSVRIIKSSGEKTLDAASTEALRRWRGRPGRAGRFFNIPINFTFNRPWPAKRNVENGLGASRSSDAGR